MKKIIIIGGGVMGSALARSLVGQYQVFVIDKNKEKLEQIKKFLGAKNIFSDYNILPQADFIILAVKPQSFLELSKEIKNLIAKKSTVISIMAGVKINKIKKLLNTDSVVRSMPNLGAKIGKSFTVWTGKKNKEITNILSAFGSELCVEDERLVDLATAVTGSGPGFLFFLLEEWIRATTKLGFSADSARDMVLSIVGVCHELLLRESDPESWRRQVTSAGGTTEAGLRVLSASRINNILLKTMKSAEKRARELAK